MATKRDNRWCSLTPFRQFYRRARTRDRATDLSPEYLQELWAKQEGKCPLTHWNLALPTSRCLGYVDKRHPANASLDRIDQRVKYRKGNVRFVALIANYARNTWTDADVIAFCKAVVAH